MADGARPATLEEQVIALLPADGGWVDYWTVVNRWKGADAAILRLLFGLAIERKIIAAPDPKSSGRTRLRRALPTDEIRWKGPFA